MDVYFEIGKKRVFASALDWPGWSRSGKDESSALQTLLSYGPRYSQAIATAQLDFTPPVDLTAFDIVARLEGNVGTDFGAPMIAPSADAALLSDTDLRRYQALLQAMWRSFERVVQAAEGKELQLGPRGGGRDLQKIISHVYEADQGYLQRLGGKLTAEQKTARPPDGLADLRQAILTTLGPAARGELPRLGPRGGERWTARFFVRYVAWHLLDHTWEIEDRIL
jgi:hypothetical protein